MKSFKQLLHRKEEQPPTEPENNEKEEMKLSEISNLDSISEAQLMKLIKQESTSTLTARLDTLIRHSKEIRFLPMETVEEKMQRRNKINKFISLFQTEINTRKRKQTSTQFQQQKDWNKENVSKLLPNIRFATKDVRLLREGMLSLDVISWSTPQDVILTIGKNKFDLRRIHPSTWQILMAHKFTPMFFQVSGGIQTGAIRDKKPMGRWRSGAESYKQNKQIKLVSPIWLAIMLV